MKSCREQHPHHQEFWRKRIRSSQMEEERPRTTRTDQFQRLPDELVTAILMALASSASCPADLHAPMLVCKRFYHAASHPWVLARAGKGALSVKASKWCDAVHQFLKRCADFGNIEACYILGMISFYCVRDRAGGASLMAKAAMAAHAEALHSLAVIKFNGSGGPKADKDLRAGVALCARAASLGHIPAMRDLGHCFQDGYGVRANAAHGRRLLLHANAREAMAAGLLPTSTSNTNSNSNSNSNSNGNSLLYCRHRRRLHMLCSSSSSSSSSSATKRRKLEEAGHHSPPATAPPAIRMAMVMAMTIPEVHPVHGFLVEWFRKHPVQKEEVQQQQQEQEQEQQQGLRMCSYEQCGRPETRRHEFRRCSACGTVNYCSRACQALHWRTIHRFLCWRAAHFLPHPPPRPAPAPAPVPYHNHQQQQQPFLPPAAAQQQHTVRHPA